MPAAIAAIVSALLEFQSTKSPRNTADLLELLVELTLGSGQQLSAAALAAVARLQLGGKGKAAQRALLQEQGI